MAKILIIGSNGMLGFDLMRVFGSDAIGLTHADIEVTDEARVRTAIMAHRPDVVISTAAMLKAELCEREPDQCFNINAMGALHVTRVCAEIGVVVVFISTDYVFGGGKDAFTENDKPHPLNVYGASKVAGERFVSFANPRHYIIRSGWFFGEHTSHKGHDFPRLMLERAKTQPFVSVVGDQRGTPTFTKDLAGIIKQLIELHAPFGTYHVAGPDACSWYEYAQTVFDVAGVQVDLRKITTQESGTTIKRPDCSALMSIKLASLGIAPLRPLREALADYLAHAEDLP